MSFSNFLESELLDHLFGASSYSVPATLYIGLSTANPGEDAAGIAEPSGNNYARKSITNDKTTFTTASNGSLSNDITITFATPGGSWGTITHFFIADASSAGNMLAYGALTASVSPTTNDTVEFAPGALNINLT